MELVLRNPARTAAALCALPILVGVAAAQPTASSRQSQILRASGGIVIAATIGQIRQWPDQWAQTTGGFSSRVADQAGIFAIRSLAHRGLSRVLPWHADTTECPMGIVSVTRCAMTQTLIARTAAGAARPDLARIGSLVLASAGPVLWRPERPSARRASAEVLARIGGGIAVAVVRRAIVASRRAPVTPALDARSQPAPTADH